MCYIKMSSPTDIGLNMKIHYLWQSSSFVPLPIMKGINDLLLNIVDKMENVLRQNAYI